MISRLLLGIGLIIVIGCGKAETSGEAVTALASKEQTIEVNLMWNGLAEAGSSYNDTQLEVQFASDRRAVLFYEKGHVSVFPLGTLLPLGHLVFDEKEMKLGIRAESSFEPEGKPTRETRVMRVATSPTRWATVHVGGFARIGEIEPCRLLKEISFGAYAVEWSSTKPGAEAAAAPRDQDWATEFGGDVRLGPQAVQFVEEGRDLALLRLTGEGDCERLQFPWQSNEGEASATKRTFAASGAEELDIPLGSRSGSRRIWLLAPDGQTVVEVGFKACAIWNRDERPFIVAYSPLPALSIARIGHDGTSLTIAGVEASRAAIDSGKLPLQVRVASLAGGKPDTVEVNGTLTVSWTRDYRDYQSIDTLVSPDKRFSIVNTMYGMPTVFDLKTKRQIKLEMNAELRSQMELPFPSPSGFPVSSPSGSVVGFGFFSIGQFTVKSVENTSASRNASSRPPINMKQDGEAAAARAINEMRENQRRAAEQNSAP